MYPALIEFLNAGAGSLVAAGWSHFVQIAVLAAVLALLDLTLGRRLGAHWRCALWMLLFVKLALPPHLALPTSPTYWWTNHASLSVPPLPATPSPRTMRTANDAWPAEPAAVEAAELESPVPAAAAVAPSWQLVVASCWLAGVAVLTTVTIVRHRRLGRILRRSVPAPRRLQDAADRARAQVGLRTRVALHLNEGELGPVVTGLWRPTIHLPQSYAARLDAGQLHAVLVHELYHVKRGDLWVAAAQAVARVVFFHHPVVWWVNVHLARLREEATDQAVLSHREVDRRSYSFALVEAAALVVRSAPLSRFALGVIETKSQLEKRITMNLYQPRSGRVQLGLPGLLNLIVLAFVLVPMTPAQPGDRTTASPAGFKAVTADSFVERVDSATAAIMETFNRGDRAAYLAGFAAYPVLLPDGEDLTVGRSGVGQMYLRAPAGLVYEPILWSDREFYQIDRWIIETGLVGFQFRTAPRAPIMTDPRQVLTIWEEDADGALRVKLLAWNRLVDLRALRRETKPQAFVSTRAGGAFKAEGDFAAVLQAEEIFHQSFEDQLVDRAVEYYADQATLIVPEKLPLHGRAAIRRHLEALPPEEFATEIEREVAHVEGNENHILVVNLFRWAFVPAGNNVPVPIVGKGVHLWQRGEDGVWRILFDLPNASQRTS